TVTHLRIDAINGEDNDALVVLNRFGFFKTRDEAMAFLADGGVENFNLPIVIDGGDYFKAVIPANTLSGAFNEAEYTLSTENHKTEGTPSNVVFRTDAEGKKELVAMSYTNDYGYTAYAAVKPGTYTLGTNHKDYSDISGHWGESYINFVSDRTLFGGTSPTEFSPEETMTRGMFITVLGRMHGLDQTKYDGNTGYTDVPATEYYAPYIQWAKETGIMAGTSDTTFAPEEPITRATMAVAIKNYTDKGGFTFEILAETEGFNDLAGLDDATVSAINAVKNVGIINGKGEGRFDPNGISTRAEVATVMERTIKACLGVLPNAAVPKTEFTKDRIAIGLWGVQASLATPEGIKDMADLGANLIISGGAVNGAPAIERVLKHADLYGIEVYLGNYFDIYEYPTAESAQAIIDERDPRLVSGRYLHHPSFAGHYEGDEPGSDHFPMLGDLIEDYEAQMPGKRAFENLLPMYANAAQLKYGASASSIEYYDADPDLYKKHCQGWVDNVDTDYICTDIYPLQWTGGKKTTYRDYLESINQIATVARDSGREFWCCIQTFGWNEGQRTPNVAEYRWQTYCMFSFGCTGILLWNYMGSENFPSLVHPKTLEKTPAFDDCKVVMHEINAISDVFMQYKNLGAYTLNTTLPYQKMSNQYTEFSTIKEIKTDAPLLVGCFDKKDGNGKAFTLVNLTDFQGNEGLVISSVSFALDDMSRTVTSYYHGQPEVLTAKDGMYTIDLEVGDGVFITVE
ncbi:MAG: S-layer homology domain-containing protein, partial [Clostridia bacterium]|nr:S-layer homology domain-containing protein [Clostridia bacterium]